MIGATFDKSKVLKLYARIGEAGISITLTFLNEDGSAHAISSYDFELPVYQSAPNPYSVSPLFTLTIGDGLTIVGTNQLRVVISAARAQRRPDTYFYKLYSDDEDSTWLNGPLFFHNGEFDGVSEPTETVTLIE